MTSSRSTPPPAPAGQDPLAAYAAHVRSLHGKLDIIIANQQSTAGSLSRAAAQLRAMARSRRT